MSTHELHDEVELVGGLEGVGEADQEGVVDVLQDHLLSLRVLDLVLLDYVVLVDALHREQLLRVLLLHQKHGPEGALAQHDLGDEVIDGHFFLEVVARVEGPGGLADHFLLFLLALEVDLEAYIVVHDELALDVLDALLLLLLLGGGVVDQVQLLPVVDGQFLASGHAVGLEDEVDDLVASVGRGVPAWRAGYL